MADIEEKLRSVAGDKADVSVYYGGFEIAVRDRSCFMWPEIFDLLLGHGYSVYVVKKDGSFKILAK